MSDGEGKYHREWASTVASKALVSLSLAGGDEVEEEEEVAREVRKSSGGCRTHVMRLPSGPCEM
jgi:hypothetical protein